MMRRVFAAALILLLIGSAFAVSGDYGADMDWFSAGEAASAPIPDGLTEREVEIYRAGHANGHYAALHPAHVEGMYVLNTRTKKFHYSDCQNTLLIFADNREHYYGTKDEVLAMGYDPCGSCKP